MEMAVILQIRAITRRSAVQVDLFHHAPADQRLQAVVHCGQRYGRHMLFRTQKHLRSSGVIPSLHQKPKDLFALFRQANSTGSKSLEEFSWKFHSFLKLPRPIIISRMILMCNKEVSALQTQQRQFMKVV